MAYDLLDRVSEAFEDLAETHPTVAGALAMAVTLALFALAGTIE